MTKEEYVKMADDDFRQSKTKSLAGALELHRNGWLNYENAIRLISCVDRAERLDNPRVYTKAIRATLMALGFKPSWVDGSFRTLLEDLLIYDEDR